MSETSAPRRPELDLMHRRITNQRRELKKMARYIERLQKTLQIAYHNQATIHRALTEERNAKYRTRAYRFWIWWRTRVVWRLGAIVPGRQQYWTRRDGYEQAQRDWPSVLR